MLWNEFASVSREVCQPACSQERSDDRQPSINTLQLDAQGHLKANVGQPQQEVTQIKQKNEPRNLPVDCSFMSDGALMRENTASAVSSQPDLHSESE